MTSLLLALIAMAAAPAPSGTAPEDTWGAGIGLESCGHWLASPQSVIEGIIWIEGYRTGINLMNRANGLVGRSSDIDGVIGEVRQICTSEPSLRLEEAAAEAYVKVWRSGR